MWSSDRRGVLAGLGALALAGCGFTPAYAPGGAGRSLRGRVRPATPANDAEFAFVRAFEDRLGRASAPEFELRHRITTSERGAARVRALGATRVSLFGTLVYELVDLASGEVVTEGSLRNFTNYSTTDTQLATRRAAEDAQARLMTILADQVAARLIAALGE